MYSNWINRKLRRYGSAPGARGPTHEGMSMGLCSMLDFVWLILFPNGEGGREVRES